MLNLSRDVNSKEPLYIDGTTEIVTLPAKNLILVDANILFPLIFPLQERTTDTVLQYTHNLNIRRGHEGIFGNKIREKEARKGIDSKIRVANYMENREFRKLGIYIGVPLIVENELKTLEGNCKRKCLDGNLARSVYFRVFLNVADCREKFRGLSEALDNGDFSLACAAIILGCDFASDDYGSFNVGVINKINKIYSQRWGIQKKLERYDSDSLEMLLYSPKIITV